MNADEIINLIEDIAHSLPERMTGNEMNAIIAKKIHPLANTDRTALLEALRKYLSFRIPPEQWKDEHAIPEAGIWMALDIAEYLKLNELGPDIESLLRDVQNRKTLLPVYEETITRSLDRLKEQVSSDKLTHGIKLS